MGQRTIKLRGWDIENKVWLPDDSLVDFDGIICENDVQTKEGNFELMEWTGLLDKRMNELYEGDFVSLQEGNFYSKWRVIFSQIWACFGIYNKDNFISFETLEKEKTNNSNIFHQLEKIGDMYQNPELLPTPKDTVQ